MEYYVFIQDDAGMEKLVASSPSLEIARKTALRMANIDLSGREVVSALLCGQESEGELQDFEIYHKGQTDPEILLAIE